MKKKYEKLSIKVVSIQVKDVITTSGFDGFDQEFGTPQNAGSANMPDSMV